MKEDLLLTGKLFATKIINDKLVENICISDNGIRCLKCIQEYYGKVWTSMDNGTYYCPKHRQEFIDDYNEMKNKRIIEELVSSWNNQCNQN